MSPRTGRPKSENAKGTMLRVRIDDSTLSKLEDTAKKLNVSKSDVVRNGINSEYEKALKK